MDICRYEEYIFSHKKKNSKNNFAGLLLWKIHGTCVYMCFCVTSKLHAVDFYGNWILSDEQQIGPRLEKEIEMYCSKQQGFRKLKDIVLLRDLHREERHIAQVLGFLHHLLLRQCWVHLDVQSPCCWVSIQ